MTRSIPIGPAHAPPESVPPLVPLPRLEVVGRRLEVTDPLRAYAERRTTLALDRVRTKIREVVIRLINVNGPRGGEDKHCRVQVLLATGGSLVIEDRDADAYVAIDRTMGRMKRVVTEHLRRRRRR